MRSRCARVLVGLGLVATAGCAGASRSVLPGAPLALAQAGFEGGEEPEPAQPVPPPPQEAPPRPHTEMRWRRPAPLPRYLGGGVTYGQVTSSAPGIGTLDGNGWNIYFGWDLTRWLDAGFRGGATKVRVSWTPNPADTSSPGECGFFGAGLLARFRPGKLVDPWIAGDVAWQAVLWDSYLHSVGGWSVLGSAGVDLHVWRWGAVRLGVSYSSFTGTTASGNGPTGPTPGPEDDGATAGMRTLWLTAGWLFDLGPAD